MAAYELGLEGQNVLMLGGSGMYHEQNPDQLQNPEEAKIAPVLHLSEAMVRHVIQEEALDTLAEVVDLGLARRAVNEAYGFRSNDDVEAPTLLPTGTSNEVSSESESQKTGPQLVHETFVPTHEAVVKHNFSSRGATAKDIETLVDVDMHAFESVYKSYNMTHEELRQDLIKKFTRRYEMLGSDWMRVVEKDGIVAGFMTCCPTSKSPEEFESWEKTTDNGTLETTFDPDGENVYIVSLSMLPGVGEAARNMLFANQIGKLIEGGYKRAFFESRLPGLGAWARRACRDTGRDFDTLTKENQQELAEQYFRTTKDHNGKKVPIDRLIRIYSAAGCKFTRVVPDAYDDAPSMNFGAVGIYENPLPKFARESSIASKAVGKVVQVLAKSHWLMRKAF
jgi:hypothetical protein